MARRAKNGMERDLVASLTVDQTEGPPRFNEIEEAVRAGLFADRVANGVSAAYVNVDRLHIEHIHSPASPADLKVPAPPRSSFKLKWRDGVDVPTAELARMAASAPMVHLRIHGGEGTLKEVVWTGVHVTAHDGRVVIHGDDHGGPAVEVVWRALDKAEHG